MGGMVGSRKKKLPVFKMSDEHRLKIANSNILNCLIKHAIGEDSEKPMTATQVSAGLALLKKILPDLSAIEISGDADNPVKMTMIVTGVPRPEDDSSKN